MATPLRKKVADLLQGGVLLGVTKLEYAWAFDFGKAVLTMECPWRVIAAGRLTLASSDDGHKFGLPRPVDVEMEANRVLGGKSVSMAVVDPEVGDLRIAFDDGRRLEVLTTSVSYEAWQLNSESSCIVVGNEGRISEALYQGPQLMVGGAWE